MSFLDIECEPPPEPAPSETMHPTHRDISIASMNAYSMKPPSSNFVLKIDKNGDQIHEEFIPKNQHGESVIFIFILLSFATTRAISWVFYDDAASRRKQ